MCPIDHLRGVVGEASPAGYTGKQEMIQMGGKDLLAGEDMLCDVDRGVVEAEVGLGRGIEKIISLG